MTNPTTEQQQIYLSIWEKAVDTQMHFNEMSVKSRQFGLGFVAAALGIGILLLSKGEQFSIPIQYFGGFDLHMTVLIFLGSAFAMRAVSILDLNVYHVMLRGAVAFGEDFEEKYMKQIFTLNKGMTQAISHFGRCNDAHVTSNNGQYVYCGDKRGNSLSKIRSFYRFSVWALIACAAFAFIITGHFGHPTPVASPQIPPAIGKSEPHVQ